MEPNSWYIEYLTGSECFCVSEGYWNNEDDNLQNVELTFHTSFPPMRTGVLTLWPRNFFYMYPMGENYE
jgi:hypothetical protein